MPKFVIEREIPGAGKMTEAELHEVALRSVEALKALGPRPWIFVGVAWRRNPDQIARRQS